MNLRDLQYLVAVADHLHFGKAAQYCHVSQPTLSMQLKKLEEYLGVQLFERTNKNVMLTVIGSEIAARARFILEEAEQIRSTAKFAGDPFAGEIRLGVFPTPAPYLLPQLMPTLKPAFPKLNVLLIEEKTPALVRLLRHGEIDYALLAMPVHEDGFSVETLFREEFLLAVSTSHRLAKRQSVTIDDMRNETMLLLEDGHCLREQALDFCHSIGVGEAKNFRATSMTTLLQMVASGSDVTLIPTLATRADGSHLVYIPFKQSPPSRTIGLYSRATSARKALFAAISTLIKKQISSYLNRL